MKLMHMCFSQMGVSHPADRPLVLQWKNSLIQYVYQFRSINYAEVSSFCGSGLNKCFLNSE